MDKKLENELELLLVRELGPVVVELVVSLFKWLISEIGNKTTEPTDLARYAVIMVAQIDEAHPTWENDQKHAYAFSGIRSLADSKGIQISDSALDIMVIAACKNRNENKGI